jgi:hypothetical protein
VRGAAYSFDHLLFLLRHAGVGIHGAGQGAWVSRERRHSGCGGDRGVVVVTMAVRALGRFAELERRTEDAGGLGAWALTLCGERTRIPGGDGMGRGRSQRERHRLISRFRTEAKGACQGIGAFIMHLKNSESVPAPVNRPGCIP